MTAKRIDELFPSGIRAVMALSQQMERQGARVIHMEVGEPHFDTPEHVKAAVADALRTKVAGYTPNLGLLSLREAVAQRVSDRHGIAVDATSVGVTSGAVMALSLSILATVDPGDEVLVPEPGWPNYFSAVALAGARAVPYQLEASQGFALDLDQIESLITPRTRMIFVNSPSNPTGAVVAEKTMRGLVELSQRHGLYVLSDEIYEDIVFDGAHHSILMDGLTDRLIMVSGASKSYAMTGWRIGWLVGPPEVVTAAGRLVEPVSSCPVTVSQIAAEAAVRGPQELVTEMRDAYRRARDIVIDVLGPLGIVPARPGGAFYALLDISATGQSSDQFTRGLLDAKHVAVAPGATFGKAADRYIRVSTALSEAELVQGCQRIREHLEDHAGSSGRL
jgi:aspartate/methionine/tyrosine aminotransferase